MKVYLIKVNADSETKLHDLGFKVNNEFAHCNKLTFLRNYENMGLSSRNEFELTLIIPHVTSKDTITFLIHPQFLDPHLGKSQSCG